MQLNFDFLFIICNINKFRSVVHALIHLYLYSQAQETMRCSKLRAIHPWRNSSVPFPSRVNFAYFKETLSALQIDENDEWQIGESSRIWIAHYHAVDTIERSNGIMLKKIQKTNFFYGTRNSKNDGGPIPDVSMVEIENGCIKP